MTIDWSKAPEGATHYDSFNTCFYKQTGNVWYYHRDDTDSWYESINVSQGMRSPTDFTPRPSEPKPYTRDEALRFLVERLDSWPTDIADAPLCPGWGWKRSAATIAFVNWSDGTIWEPQWQSARPDFVPFVSVEDAQPIAGQKFDTGKPIIGAIPAHAELAVARVMTFGAQKYARDNWRKIDDIPTRYMDAALRHLNAVRRGETVDPESGEHHLAHAACCILFMLDVVEAGNAQTDR